MRGAVRGRAESRRRCRWRRRTAAIRRASPPPALAHHGARAAERGAPCGPRFAPRSPLPEFTALDARVQVRPVPCSTAPLRTPSEHPQPFNVIPASAVRSRRLESSPSGSALTPHEIASLRIRLPSGFHHCAQTPRPCTLPGVSCALLCAFTGRSPANSHATTPWPTRPRKTCSPCHLERWAQDLYIDQAAPLSGHPMRAPAATPRLSAYALHLRPPRPPPSGTVHAAWWASVRTGQELPRDAWAFAVSTRAGTKHLREKRPK